MLRSDIASESLLQASKLQTLSIIFRLHRKYRLGTRVITRLTTKEATTKEATMALSVYSTPPIVMEKGNTQQWYRMRSQTES